MNTDQFGFLPEAAPEGADHGGPLAAAAASPMADLKPVGMGQIVMARGSAVLTAVLGSCVAVVLHCRRRGVGAVAHVVLPDSAGRAGPAGKFADTAVPAMLTQLAAAGIQPEELYARLVGGASMFGSSMPLQVGSANAEAVCRALTAAGIPLTRQDVGGSKGRRIRFHCDTGILVVEVLGQVPHTL